MLITKFNQMIRNRVLWAFFAVIVSVSFVGAFSSSGGCQDNSKGGVGQIFERPVSEREFAIARYFAIGLRDDLRNVTPEMEQRIRDYTWRRMAALEMAEKMGVVATDDELRQQIQQDPTFQVQGTFSPDRFHAVLRSRQLPIEMFEAYLREEIVLGKVSKLLETAAWVPPSEVQTRIDNLTDHITITYTELTRDLVGDVTVTDEEVRAYFEDNQELFRVPVRTSVRYVAFEVSNYLAEVTVEADAVTNFYARNSEDYSVVDTNGVTNPRPLDEVRDDIVESIRSRRALYAAKDAAALVVEELAPDRDGNSPLFETVAIAHGCTAATSELFSADGPVEGLNVGKEFIDAALRLDGTDMESYFSDPVVGADAVYVLATNRSLLSYIPDLSNVVARVQPAALSNAVALAFADRADEIRQAVEKAVTEDNVSFADAVAGYGLNVSTTLTFTAADASAQDIEYFYPLIPAAIEMSAGQVLDILPVETGALLAMVTQRTPGDVVSAQLMRQRVAQTIARYRAGLAFGDWAEYVLKEKAQYHDYEAEARAGAAEAYDEDEADEERYDDTDSDEL